MHKLTNTENTNAILINTVFIPYIAIVLYVCFDAGITDWNFLNTLPVANVSPFMFTIVPLCMILPKKFRKHLTLLVALLSIGMLFAPIISCTYYASIGYKFHPHFLLDYVSHFALFLLGVYYVKSGQVELKIRDCITSGSLIVGVAWFMMLLNVIFDKSFFGLSLLGKHNIYNFVFTDNSFLSAFVYFCGLILVLAIGFLFQKYVITNKKRTL